MKKSDIYKKLQIGVIEYYDMLETGEKIEILRELMNREDLELYSEKQEASEDE